MCRPVSLLRPAVTDSELGFPYPWDVPADGSMSEASGDSDVESEGGRLYRYEGCMNEEGVYDLISTSSSRAASWQGSRSSSIASEIQATFQSGVAPDAAVLQRHVAERVAPCRNGISNPMMSDRWNRSRTYKESRPIRR